MRWVLYLSILMTFVALACCIISICIPYWLYSQDPQLSYQGLWQRCTPVGTQGAGDNVKCELILLPPEFLDATRVMMLFGMSLYIFATICSLVYVFCRQEKTSLITAATFLMLFGGILCMVGVVVYGAMYPILLRAKGLSLHAGFALGVCSVVAGFVTTLFYCMARAKGDVE